MRFLSISTAALIATFAMTAVSQTPAETTDAKQTTDKVVISQKGKVFDREALTIKQGESLVFRNDDPVTHNVFSRTKGNEFNLKMQKLRLIF